MSTTGDSYLIGLDYGSESARGVLLDAESGRVINSLTHEYRHGVMSASLPNGEALARGWALQVATDYTEAAEIILGGLGRGRHVLGIGIGFTASSPLPCRADGTPLSTILPRNPHAYVKLWKHQAAQPWANRINARGGDYLVNCGGRLSGEWLLAKAAQIADESPEIWNETERFIEAGDWLVWQLTGSEARSESFATYKAHYRREHGYPRDIVPGLAERLADPLPVGSSAGPLCPAWCDRTGILGQPAVAVAIIDSHVAMPALGVVDSGSLMGALGTSAVFLLLDKTARPLPKGIEGTAYSAAIPGAWCYEAGQASFGDLLAWFVNAFPRSGNARDDFVYYGRAATLMSPEAGHLLALDWWNGCRVPFGDSALSGLLVGMNMRTTAVDIYRALMESICFGARTIVDLMASSGSSIERVVLTGGLSQKNDLLMQMLADVLGCELQIPLLAHPTAIGAAIHGAVAAGVVADYGEGARRFGARDYRIIVPTTGVFPIYDERYRRYSEMAGDSAVRNIMHALGK
ncbi:MAG: FGGY-family carbohydrate kinase [Propionivibrio sp.]